MHKQTEMERGKMLTACEGEALSMLREIVAGIRARGVTVDIGSLEWAIRAAGGSRVAQEGEGSPDTFTLNGARFTAKPSASAVGKIEVFFKT
jgi:hypothetical protein